MHRFEDLRKAPPSLLDREHTHVFTVVADRLVAAINKSSDKGSAEDFVR